jgi:S1-C subfamily serine protease
MSRAFLPLSICMFLIASPGLVRSADDKKTDLETTVAEGKEVSLTPVEITPSDKPDNNGIFTATVKPAKEAKKVKMPAQAYGLGFAPEAVKEGLKVVELPESSGLLMMRIAAGKAEEEGAVRAEVGDIIAYVNGYAVKSAEELIAAVSTAKDKKDVQIVIKDVNTGDLQILYATAVKK